MPALLALLPLILAPKFDFYDFGPYDRNVPRPEALLGYGPGAQHTTFRDQEKAYDSMASRMGARVKAFPYGKSTEGRPLRVFAISSPKNMAKLDQIRLQMSQLNEGKGTPPGDLPAFVWINETIHGNETASFESGMWLFYTLGASQAWEKILENVVVILNPVYNPDGHERFVVWFNSIARGDADPGAFEQREPGLIHGRTNHYRFDMNRDRIAMSQAETRQEVAEFLKWTPQVYVDQHGQVDTYFFPPNAMSQNANTDRARLDKWTEIFGRATGKAFDKEGWPYFIRDTFDAYYPGYLDTFTTLSGAIGMTHETDGGRMIRRKRDDGSELTLRDGMEKHFSSALAVIKSAGENKSELLNSWAGFKRKVNSGEAAGKFQRVVVSAKDPRPLKRLAAQLSRMGVKSAFAEGFSQSDAHDYWTGKAGPATFPEGSLVIDMNQPQGAVAKAMLELSSDFESEFVAEQKRRREQEKDGDFEGYEFYDLTGWSLPIAHGLDAWWCESRPEIKPFVADVKPQVSPVSSIGYLVRYGDMEDGAGVVRAAQRGVRFSVFQKEAKIDGQTFPAGTLQALNVRNDENLLDVLQRELKGTAIHAITSGFPDSGRQGPGSENVRGLMPPTVGMIWGDTDRPTGYGSTWYLLDEVLKIKFTALPRVAMSGGLGGFNVLLCPEGSYDAPSDALKSWVNEGGCLVLLGPSRLSQDKGFLNLEAKEGTALPGSLFKGQLDAKSPLAYGFARTDRIPVVADGSRFFKTGERPSVLTVPGGDQPNLLSGWNWPEDSEKDLRGTAWLHVQRVGQGKVISFMQNPAERAMWPSHWQLLLNSILFGSL